MPDVMDYPIDNACAGDIPAIDLRAVSKEYRLYASRVDQALDVTGLGQWLFWRSPSYQPFQALQNIDLQVSHGERVGVIGRNGAGKTTLLKLVSENFSPSTGTIRINGTVQALMQVGMGFHDEFSGWDNIHSALEYSGLSGPERDAAVRDIVDFVELGEFLNQPIKTYSLGMRARLQFAAATAVRPDILIVDEVLGAGDAYFASKSSARMKKLTSSGCTLVLVSHAMDQVLQFCTRAVWLEKGQIVMDGPAIEVVRAYEKFSYELRVRNATPAGSDTASDGRDIRPSGPLPRGAAWQREGDAGLLRLDGSQEADGADGRSVSRWQGLGGLEICAVSIRCDGVESGPLKSGGSLEIGVEAVARRAGLYPYRFVILVFTEDGRPLSRHSSPHKTAQLREGDRVEARMHYERALLGRGRYLLSIAIFKDGVPRDRTSAAWYDLLSRSFQFEVRGMDDGDPTLFHHPAEWVIPCDKKGGA